MNLSNKTGNFLLPYLTYGPVIFLIFSNLPKYVMSFGIIGNVVSLFIFSRPCLNNKTNSGKLYAFLCCLSLIIIIYNMTGRTLDIEFSFKFRLPLNSQILIDMIILQYWSWIQVLITFDRFIGVFYPVKGVRIMGKKWVLYSIILGLIVFILGVNSPNYITCYSTRMVGNKTYIRKATICDDVVVLTGIVQILMQFVVPYLLMVIVDAKVIIRIRKLKTCLGERQSTSSNKSLRFSRNTILIDLIYLIFNLPPTIFYAYSVIISIVPKLDIFQLYSNMNAIFKFFPYIYPSILFFVFITFNRIFRSEFISIVIYCFIEIKNKLF